MPIRFLCRSCQAKIKVPGGSEGRRVKCPRCGFTQSVPTKVVMVDAKTGRPRDDAGGVGEQPPTTPIEDGSAPRDANDSRSGSSLMAAYSPSDDDAVLSQMKEALAVSDASGADVPAASTALSHVVGSPPPPDGAGDGAGEREEAVAQQSEPAAPQDRPVLPPGPQIGPLMQEATASGTAAQAQKEGRTPHVGAARRSGNASGQSPSASTATTATTTRFDGPSPANPVQDVTAPVGLPARAGRSRPPFYAGLLMLVWLFRLLAFAAIGAGTKQVMIRLDGEVSDWELAATVAIGGAAAAGLWLIAELARAMRDIARNSFNRRERDDG